MLWVMEGSNSEPAVPDGSSSSSGGTDQQPSQSDAQQGAITNDTAATTTEDPEETVVNNESSNGWYSSWKTGFASSFTANALVVPGLLLALFGFVLMVLSQRWTMKNDKLQDCINLRVGHCPERIERLGLTMVGIDSKLLFPRKPVMRPSTLDYHRSGASAGFSKPALRQYRLPFSIQ